MSFSSEQFIGKLKNLHDSQDSISSSAKWLLSQYRDSEAIAHTWGQYVTQKDLPERKRLLAVYLVNHVVQQGKSQGIGQFQDAFASVLVDTLPTVYSHFPPELQAKLKRVVNIWKQRKVFNSASLEQMETNLRKIKPATTTTSTDNISNITPSVPSNIQPIVELCHKLNKNKHNIPALKSRFDNAINDLDVNSVVYKENFHTVTKIAKVTQDTIKESMHNREHLVKRLQSLLHDEEGLLEQDRVLLNEIEFALDSKDPTKVQMSGTNGLDNVGSAVYDVLPTYGRNDSDSDSDSDSDKESSKSADDDNDDVTEVHKRSSGEIDTSNTNSEEPLEKKYRAFNDGEEEEYIVDGLDEQGEEELVETADAAATSEVHNSVTSNIQDLLSRLAN